VDSFYQRDVRVAKLIDELHLAFRRIDPHGPLATICQHRHEQRSGYECTGTRFHRARDAPDPEETDIAPVYRSRSSLPRFQSRRDPRMSLFGSRPPLHIKSSSAEFPLDTETLQSLTAWRILQVDWRVRLVRPAGADI